MPQEELLPSPSYYLKMSEIKGDSTHKDHPNEIVVESFSWGESQTALAPGSGKARGGSVSMRDVQITAKASSATPLLMSFCAAGKPIKSATLVFIQKEGKGAKVALTIELTDVRISSFQTGGSGASLPVDTFTLEFGKIDVRYSGDKPDGTPGKNTTGSWDLKTNQP